MFVAILRIVLVRVRPDVLLSFEPYDDDTDDGSSSASPDKRKNLRSRFQSALNADGSLFSWGDKGWWETIDDGHRPESREADWFRFGFEPVFLSYTKRGVYFVVVSLFEVGLHFLAARCCRTSVQYPGGCFHNVAGADSAHMKFLRRRLKMKLDETRRQTHVGFFWHAGVDRNVTPSSSMT